MTFISASLKDSKSHLNASKPLDTDMVIERIENIRLIENGCLYKPLVILSSKLNALDAHIDAASEVRSKHVNLPINNSYHPDLSIPPFSYEGFLASSRCTFKDSNVLKSL